MPPRARRAGTRRLLLGTTAVVGAYLVVFDLLAPFWTSAPLTRAALAVRYTFDPAFSVAAMPVLIALCARGVEGSQFTAYMALVNLADVVGSSVSGYALLAVPAPAIGLACTAVAGTADDAGPLAAAPRAAGTIAAPGPRP